MAVRKFGAEPIGKAIQDNDEPALTRYLAYADSTNPGTRRMIVNGEWMVVRTDNLGDSQPTDQEWPAYVEHGEQQ